MAQPESPWYVDFFARDYREAYEHILTSQPTDRQVAFAAHALGLAPGERVLDLCCGHGRHAIPLARQGLRVTGLDLNAESLEEARRSAQAEGLDLELVRGDMRRIPYDDHFDAVVNMFTSFGYLEPQEDMLVLQEVSKALKPGGRLLMDLLNREWVINNYIQDEERRAEDGTVFLEHRELDLTTSRNTVTFTIVPPDGARRQTAPLCVRLYTLTEVIGMLAQAGLAFQRVYGGFEGEDYTIDTRRMIVVATRDTPRSA